MHLHARASSHTHVLHIRLFCSAQHPAQHHDAEAQSSMHPVMSCRRIGDNADAPRHTGIVQNPLLAKRRSVNVCACSRQHQVLAGLADLPLHFQDRDYRLSFAKDPGPPHQQWGTLRKVQDTVRDAREECITCDSASLCHMFACSSAIQRIGSVGRHCDGAKLICALCGNAEARCAVRCVRGHLRLSCRACGHAASRGSCKHMAASNAPAARLSDEARQKQFDRFFDVTRGDRRLTCKSREPIPECMATSSRHDEWQGARRFAGW